PIIALEGSNPIVYLYRGEGYLRSYHYDQARQDAETGKKLGPVGWTSPLIQLAGIAFANKNYDEAVSFTDQIIQVNPKDWYALASRAACEYFAGKLDEAKADLDKAIAINPNSSLPYMFTASLALRQGRIADAKAAINVILTRFAVPS